MALDLHSRIGGIPVTVIGGVVGLGLVGAMYFQSARSSSKAVAPTTQAYPDLGPGDQVDTTDKGSSSSLPEFVSNATWTATALGWMVTTQGASPLTVQRTIAAYMNGDDLTYEQGQMMDQIIGRFGLPPQGVTGISSVLPKATLPSKDPVTETPVVAPSTGSYTAPAPMPASPIPTQAPAPVFTHEFFDIPTGLTITNLSDGSNLISDQNKTYAAGSYMSGGNVYNADGTPANDAARATQARLNAMFGR